MKKFLLTIFISSASILILGCDQMQSSRNDIVVPEPEFKLQPLKTDTSDFLPLAWDKNANRAEWSKMIYSIIENEEHSLLETNAARDIENFCPRYNDLNDSQRLNFWGQFFVALAYPESGWNPLSQMVEKGAQKADPVTGRPVKSEGLLQLSYQDEKSYRIDCGFNWGIDRYLSDNDGRRTILHPFLNLRCGIKIMAIQLKKRGLIQVKDKYYWHVLKINGRSEEKIKNMTRSLEICQKR